MSFSLSSLNPLNLLKSSTPVTPTITSSIGAGSITPQQAVAIAAILNQSSETPLQASNTLSLSALESQLAQLTEQIAVLKGL